MLMIFDWIKTHAVRSSPRNSVALMAAVTATLIALPGGAKGYTLFPEEPTKEVIQSGLCEVPVCAEVDFGDYYFRYYAADRAARVRHISKGTCECKKIRRIDGDHIVLGVETRDGKFAPNVSVLRIYPPGHPRKNSANMTTWEEYSRSVNDFDEISDFQFDGDSFPSFRVFRSRRPRGEAHMYFFVPKSAQFNFLGHKQPIAFNIPLGHPHYDNTGKLWSTVGSQVELASSVHFFQFFSPHLVPSDDWITSMERSAEVIDARLFPKSK
jgi:hypothetical protein